MSRLALALSIACTLALALDVRAQDAAPSLRCEISGTVHGLEIRGGSPRRRMTLDGVAARIVPIRRGLSLVSATLDDGSLVEGRSRLEVPFEVATDLEAADGILALHPGARTRELSPIEGATDARVELLLGEGVVARELVLPCGSLRPASGASLPAASTALPPATPRWRPRVRDLHVHSGHNAARGTDLSLDVEDAELVLAEEARHRGWVQIVAELGGGRIRGWVADTDLAPAR